MFEAIKGDKSRLSGTDSSADSELHTPESIIIKYVVLNAASGDDSITAQYEQLEPSSSLKDLLERIAIGINLPDDQVMELYCKDGYPLNNNSFMNQGWCISVITCQTIGY